MSKTYLFHIRDYRGATVEDLDIKPAISINPTTPLHEALEIAYEYEFTYLPVIDERNKKLLGIFNVEELSNSKAREGKTYREPIVKNYMLWFHQSTRERYEEDYKNKLRTNNTSVKATIKGLGNKMYTVITPLTPLEKLAEFFNKGNFFAIVTNAEGSFVYGVATPEDLTRYEQSRPRL